jgi:PAS domain S-box-containing protein
MGSGLLLAARRADGTEFPVEISLSPWQVDGTLHVLAAVRDVTERVEAEDHMHRVLHTLDASDDGVFIFDADDLRYSYVNDGAARLVGYTQDELIGMTPLHLNPHASEADYRKLVTALLERPDDRVVHRASLMRKDGVEVPVEKTYKAAPSGRTGPRWVIALARDITSRLSTDEQLRSSERALQQAEGVVAIVQDRERIARDLHDTVIQRLFGAGLALQAVAAIADDAVRPRIEATIDDLDATIRELRTAIFSLQDRTPAPSGRRGRILQVVDDAGTMLGFHPRLHMEGPVESIDDTTAEHLVAILREALSNVARHAGASAVLVTLSVTGEHAELSVTDDGRGLGDPIAAFGPGGEGLANMRSRADQLHGELTISGDAENGTRIVVRVPLVPPGQDL